MSTQSEHAAVPKGGDRDSAATIGGSGNQLLDDAVTARSAWNIAVADVALRSRNPIRRIIEGLQKPVLPEKPHIPLSIGDPTVFGNFRAPNVLLETVARNVLSCAYNGYMHSAGSVEARRAVAAWSSVPGRVPLTENDVVIASGCSGALDLAITVLLNPG